MGITYGSDLEFGFAFAMVAACVDLGYKAAWLRGECVKAEDHGQLLAVLDKAIEKGGHPFGGA